MRPQLLTSAALLIAFQVQGFSQTPAPLYQVTIVSRTTKAVNYGYLAAPTRIGFQGTPVAPEAQGKATIDPKRGATHVDLRVEKLPPPSRFGQQFLTYVVWAISPDGRAQSMGELILEGSDKGRLQTSTPLQTFALIVTAEPYYSVSQPSEVVVLENVVTSETIGKVQEVNATYELLPRKPYTYEIGAQPATPQREAVSPEQYRSITALYQALNAIQIAQAQGADRYAPNQLARARELYNTARGYPVHMSKQIVTMAREAAQIAEDSRAIAVKRASAEKAAEAATATEPEPQTRGRQPELPEAVTPATGPGEQTAPPESEPRPPVEVDHAQFLRDHPEAAENRRRLLAALPRTFEVIDTSRGVTLILPEHAPDSALTPSYFQAVAAAIRPYRDLHIKVEANSDAAGSEEATQRTADLVRRQLIAAGISPNIIVSRGLGDSRPRTSNATAAGRAQNRRIEIIVAGDAIGSLATWDSTYSIVPPQR